MADPAGTALTAIAALARSGAHERAWELFGAGGHDRAVDDQAALSVKGRLLAERARHGSSAAHAAAFRSAADAYAAANALAPAPWLAINAGSCRLLGGDADAARACARDVVAMLDDPDGPADTPYFRCAIRAAAALLLGDEAAAHTAMRAAAKADPDGWDDRAATVRQLAEIAAAQQIAVTWLDDFRPPASLHFAGHMALVSGGAGEAALAARMDEIIAADRIGFAFGTAAAGSDIVMAERLLAAGGELVLVLPCEPGLFERQSVAPAGAGWAARYRALLGHAEGVLIANPAGAGGYPEDLHDPLATHLAGRMAIGEALLQSRRLASASVQAIAFDLHGGGVHSRRLAAQWPAGAAQRSLTIPRETDVRTVFAGDIDDPARRLAALVSVGLDLGARDHAALREACRPVWDALSGIDPATIAADHRGWDILCDEPDQAAALALDLLAACRAADAPPPSIGLACGIVSAQRDEPTGTWIARGPMVPAARKMARQAEAGTCLATTPFALVLAAQDRTGARCELAHRGEGGAGDAVYRVLPEGDRAAAG